jgi:hypothetical protein
MWFYFLLGGGIVLAFFALRWLDRLDGINRFKQQEAAHRLDHIHDNSPTKLKQTDSNDNPYTY